MFLTCQVDLPVAITMKSQWCRTGITLTSSALTSFRICSISCKFSNCVAFLLSTVEDDQVRFNPRNPSFHCWRLEKEEEDARWIKAQDLWAANIWLRRSAAAELILVLKFLCSKTMSFQMNDAVGDRLSLKWKGAVTAVRSSQNIYHFSFRKVPRNEKHVKTQNK